MFRFDDNGDIRWTGDVSGDRLSISEFHGLVVDRLGAGAAVLEGHILTLIEPHNIDDEVAERLHAGSIAQYGAPAYVSHVGWGQMTLDEDTYAQLLGGGP